MNEALNVRLLKALGQRIRELRTEKGYSQEAFADRCGVHRTFMGTVERGESNLSFQNIARVAENLGVSLSMLFQGLEARAEKQMPASKSDASTQGKRRSAKKPMLPAVKRSS